MKKYVLMAVLAVLLVAIPAAVAAATDAPITVNAQTDATLQIAVTTSGAVNFGAVTPPITLTDTSQSVKIVSMYPTWSVADSASYNPMVDLGPTHSLSSKLQTYTYTGGTGYFDVGAYPFDNSVVEGGATGIAGITKNVGFKQAFALTDFPSSYFTTVTFTITAS
jgi:hypothetical protein